MSSNPTGVFTFFNLSKNYQNIFFGQILTNFTKPVKVFLILKCTFIQMVLFRNWSNVFRKASANYNIQMIFYWNENILKWSDAMGDNDSCHTDFQHLFCFRWHHSDSWWNRYLPSGQSSRKVQVCLHLSFLREIEKCPHLLLIVYGRVDNRWLARNTSLQSFFFKHIGNQKCFWLSNQINKN